MNERLGNTWNLNFHFRFQIFLSRQDRKTNLFDQFLGEVMARQFCFEISWLWNSELKNWICRKNELNLHWKNFIAPRYRYVYCIFYQSSNILKCTLIYLSIIIIIIYIRHPFKMCDDVVVNQIFDGISALLTLWILGYFVYLDVKSTISSIVGC